MTAQHDAFDGDLQVVKAKLSHIETGLTRLETAMVQGVNALVNLLNTPLALFYIVLQVVR